MLKSKEVSNLVIFGIFVFAGLPRTFAFPDFVKKNGLNINGSHVCQNPVSKTVNMKIIRQHEYKVRHNTTCSLKGWLWGSWKIPCVKSRIRLQNFYQLTVQKLYGYSLGCCHRWQKINQNDTECLKPICIHGCKHGKCVAGDKCHCEPGWRGYTCNQDINECYDNNGGCQHECHNTVGSHVCGCRRGYTPDANDTTKCSDINECKIPQFRCLCADQKCNATCVNTIGSFKCICPNGYRLNGLNNCIDVDECLSSVTNNCPHKCANTLGSFQCTCFKGFVYGKSRRCEDLNECADNNGGCEHKCLNVYGSSRCRCRRGYRLTPDRKKCRLFNYSLN